MSRHVWEQVGEQQGRTQVQCVRCGLLIVCFGDPLDAMRAAVGHLVGHMDRLIEVAELPGVTVVVTRKARSIGYELHASELPHEAFILFAFDDDRVTSDAEVISQVTEMARLAEGPVLVIHDADHRRESVLVDLECYAPLVTPGSYLIVEDTNVNGHPVLVDWGPGPWEAVDNFLSRHAEFERDPSREKFLLTYNPGGYLRRRMT